MTAKTKAVTWEHQAGRWWWDPPRLSGGALRQPRPFLVKGARASVARALLSELGICQEPRSGQEKRVMNNVIYIVGVVVVALAVLSFFGLR